MRCNRCRKQAVVEYVRTHPLLCGQTEHLCGGCSVAVMLNDETAADKNSEWVTYLQTAFDHQQITKSCQCNHCHLAHARVAESVSLIDV